MWKRSKKEESFGSRAPEKSLPIPNMESLSGAPKG